MADTKRFWLSIGMTFWAVTMLVVLHAGAVVYAHVDGRLSLDNAQQVAGNRHHAAQ